MRISIRFFLGIFLLLALHAHSQTDSAHRKRPLTARQKLIPNTIKLELVYKDALVSEYSMNGGSRSYYVYFPYIRVNDAKPVEIDKHADFLRTFYTKCSQADEQIDLMNQQMRRAKLEFAAGIGLGTGIAFTGMFRAASKSNSDLNAGTSTFFIYAGVGSLIMFGGAYLAHLHAKHADEHLRLSVDIYNSRCYKPLPSDTARPKTAAAATPEGDNPVVPSPRKLWRDTAYYQLVRNEPSHSGLYGLNISPFYITGAQNNLNMGGGAGFFYTYESLFGINVNYQRAYLDDLTGDNRGQAPSGDAESSGAPVHLAKSSLWDIRAKFTTVSWEKESYYHIKLGNTRIGNMPAEVVGRVRGNILQAITARLGYIADHRLVENANGIAYKNATPVYNYIYQGQSYPLTPDNLATSSTMVRSGIIAAGIGYSTYRDLKIDVIDETYSGRREEKAQTDLYADVLYAHSMMVDDMIYYHALEPRTGEYIHLPQRLDVSKTPVKKIGFRAGLQTLAMYRPHFGVRSLIEFGLFPGVQTMDNKPGLFIQGSIAFVFGGRISQQ